MKRIARIAAFTLIELLTVIAITAVLLTLIIVPIVQSFNLTRAAQGFAEAQERARLVVDRMLREVTNAAGVRDNTGSKGAIGVVVIGSAGTPVEALMMNTKLDVVKPAEGEPDSSGNFTNPNTGKIDPTLVVPRGQVTLPVAPGLSYVRYFVGLADPLDGSGPSAYAATSYNNPYDGLLMGKNSRRDNLYVLYRVEYQPYVWNSSINRYVVNPALFVDQDGDNVPDDWDDPYFFTFRPTIAGPALTDFDASGQLINQAGDPRGQAKARRIAQWIKRAVVLTDVHRYDMIQPIHDKRSRQVTYINNVPQLISLIQFRPTRITSEPAEGHTAMRIGEETENMGSLAPDVYTTKFGAWVSVFLRTWPNGWDRNVPVSNSYLVGRIDAADGDFKVFGFDPDLAPSELTGGTPAFNVSRYQRLLGNPQPADPYPFTGALEPGLSDVTLRNLFIPYHFESRSGRVFTGFAITEVGDGPRPPLSPPNDPDNLPRKDTTDPGGPNPQVPINDAAVVGQPFTNYDDWINRLFNWVWNNYNGNTAGQPNLQPNIHRFVDLRMQAQVGNVPSPLHPDPATGFARAKIVPNSDIVYGPDQNSGPNYGNMVRYTRTTRTPGPNQYRINYVDLKEPDYTLLGLPAPPANYDPNNFMSVVYQPRFKAGYVQLNSDPNVALPGDNPGTPERECIRVYYKFQMTHPKDVFAVDYDTRQLMSILLTVRNYPQTSLPDPQTVTLKANAKVRNFLR